MVNKPDWFEPGELTYIGFDNDYSDIPTYESDKIDFSIDYDDTNKKFLDGSNFNTNHTSGVFTGINNKNAQGTGGLIAGPKKILRFETTAGKNPTMRNGYYEIDSGTYRLKFSHKGLVKLVVAPATAAEAGVGLGQITFYDTNIDSTSGNVKNVTTNTPVTLNTPQTITGSQEFVFSGGITQKNSLTHERFYTGGANFGKNLCVKKVLYNLSNAVITKCELYDQQIRFLPYYHRQRSIKIYSDGNSYDNTTLGTLSSHKKCADTCINFLHAMLPCENNYGVYATNNSSTTILFDVYGVTGKCKLFVDGWSGVNIGLCTDLDSGRYYEYSHGQTNGWKNYMFDCDSYSPDKIMIRVLKNTSGGDCMFWTFNIINSNKVTTIPEDEIPTEIEDNPFNHDELTKNKGIYLMKWNGENWICFQGDGELHVEVAEDPVTGYIKHLNKDQEQTQTEVTGNSTYQTLSIDPDLYHYESNADGSLYVVKLDLQNLELDTEYGVQFAS